jgi:NADPH:quinone reductase-like Zn-dependent oxidoreductase
MKTVRIHRYGPSSELKLEDVPRPSFKDTDVLVRILDAGVNPIDWKLREGLMRDIMPVRFPLTLGQDFAGEVLEVGEAVLDIKVGDAVFGWAHGAYAEEAAIDEEKLALMPESIDFATAAAIPTAGVTAWQAVIHEAKVREGQRVLIHGAAGGVGTFATQLALWKGAQVVANASAEDTDYLHGLGVDLVIDHKTDDFATMVEHIDVVIDLVGGETLARSFNVLNENGIVVTTVGPMPGEHRGRGVALVMNPVARDLAQIAQLVDQGVIVPKVSRVFRLEDAKVAQDLSQFGHLRGKIVLETM